MDNLVAIGVGLGLRAIIDTVTQHNHRVNGSLVGLWEGAVLRHFITKYPSSLDPYISYGFRLLVDLLWTNSWTRLVIVVLWTLMGMVLTDVAVDLYADRRFRRLTRAVRYTVLYPLLRQVSSSRRSTSASAPSRVQFFQVPVTTSTTSTARTPGPPRSATPGPVRRPALRVPGSFSASETDTDVPRPPPISRDNSSASQQDGSTTSRSSSSRAPSVTFSDPVVSQRRSYARGEILRRPTVAPSIASILSPPPITSPVLSPPVYPVPPPMYNTPYSVPLAAEPTVSIPTPPPVRPPTPELEYLPSPIPNIVRNTLSDDEGSVNSRLSGGRSGLTTPNVILSPRSGLTTPEQLRNTLPSQGSSTITGGSEATATPLPIPVRLHDDPNDAEQVTASLLHPNLLPNIPTPQPSPSVVVPVEYLPSPSPEDNKSAVPIRMSMRERNSGRRMTTSEPPPAYEQMPEEDESGENTPAASVISNAADRQRLLQRAESLRNVAEEADKRRARLKREFEEARRSREHWTAFRLKHEMDRAEKETRELHAKAARRFYQAHNLKPEPQTIDVHRLKVPEALEKVEQALYDSLVTNTPELRIITGRGNHSRNGIPALKLAIIGAMADYHLDISTDPNNSGVLIVNPPSNPNQTMAGPSSSS